ncbi:MAG: Rne/Rng family ribonuclease [Bacteroidales bacterium]|nr:Rne/Rng family ribonuclease [Bacteroidales bacterium]MBQ3576692.1 Rne/Rng family ribonuclease [Coprobacter sp.]
MLYIYFEINRITNYKPFLDVATTELVIDVQQKEVSIALLEDKRLVELQKESSEVSFSVGDIYLARVKKTMPGLNAAFIDVGYSKEAFLHYLDLGEQYISVKKYLKQITSDRKKQPESLSKFRMQPELPKEGSIESVLSVGDEILVQITKEPISTKGPRLTAEISIPGRFLVLVPFSDKVSLSQKIKSNSERTRLKQLIQSIKPQGFGVIVRTVAEGKKVAELDNELKTLVKCWEEAMHRVQRAKIPSLVNAETSRTVAVLRDLYNPSFENIYVNDKETFAEIENYISLIAPERKDFIKLYTGELPIFDNFAITKQIKSSFGKTIAVKNGSYLVIEHTEALHVIDVNSGPRSKAEGQEENAIEVNLAAAEEIARQLRLRDMGGIIVVDFIDMDNADNRQLLYDHMRELMSKDRAKHNILPLTKFGLMQITRHRVRPVLNITVTENCPVCNGKGKINSSILFVDIMEEKIAYIVKKMRVKRFSLHLHPYVAAYINSGIFSLKMRWKLKYSPFFKIIPNQSLALLEYKIYDNKRNEIDLKDEIEVKL